MNQFSQQQTTTASLNKNISVTGNGLNPLDRFMNKDLRNVKPSNPVVLQEGVVKGGVHVSSVTDRNNPQSSLRQSRQVHFQDPQHKANTISNQNYQHANAGGARQYLSGESEKFVSNSANPGKLVTSPLDKFLYSDRNFLKSEQQNSPSPITKYNQIIDEVPQEPGIRNTGSSRVGANHFMNQSAEESNLDGYASIDFDSQNRQKF